MGWRSPITAVLTRKGKFVHDTHRHGAGRVAMEADPEVV